VRAHCIADEIDSGPGPGRVFIKPKRKLKAGEELFYIGLISTSATRPKMKKGISCPLRQQACRATMRYHSDTDSPHEPAAQPMPVATCNWGAEALGRNSIRCCPA
jgi:hypothetical protein